jgi:RNA polymerase sigma-70 factor, ECF subfamily
MSFDDEELNRQLAVALKQSFECFFECLMRNYQKLLYSFVMHMLPHPRDTEDIVQEIFLRAYRALVCQTSEEILAVKLRPWIFTIARNVSLNYITRGGTNWYYSDSIDTAAVRNSYEATPHGQHPSSERITEQQETFDELYFYIKKLPLSLRTSVVLYYIVNLSYSEIAMILDQPLNTVKSNGRRGLKKLQEMMKDQKDLYEEIIE